MGCEPKPPERGIELLDRRIGDLCNQFRPWIRRSAHKCFVVLDRGDHASRRIVDLIPFLLEGLLPSSAEREGGLAARADPQEESRFRRRMAFHPA